MSDTGSPARGCAYGVVLSVPFWLAAWAALTTWLF